MTRAVLAAVIALGAAVVAPACGNSATSDGAERDATGSVVGGGDVGAFRLQLGDCIESLGDGDGFDSLPVVPCSARHQAEIYHVFDLADGPWPGSDAVRDRAADGCVGAFARFVGVDFAASSYDVTPLRPSEASWNEIGDRQVLCALFEVDGSPMTGSARATAR
ncbi:MAG: septum formation family protein [Actinomycetota bacterium]